MYDEIDEKKFVDLGDGKGTEKWKFNILDDDIVSGNWDYNGILNK